MVITSESPATNSVSLELEETTESSIQPIPSPSTPQTGIQVLTPGRDLLWPEFTVNNAKTKNAFGYFVVPIVTIGKWEHPYYGEVVFDQPTVDQLIQNFNAGTCCYDPALYVGHPGFGDGGGRPAAGFLEVLLQQEDVLWGIFAAVDDQVYLDVKKGKYRYSSAELMFNYVHSQTLEEHGPVITGCAITNEPFLTNMPPIKAFSQPTCTAQTLAFTSKLQHNSCVIDNPMDNESLNLATANNTGLDLTTNLSTTTFTAMDTNTEAVSNSTLKESVPAETKELNGGTQLSVEATSDLTVLTNVAALNAEVRDLKLALTSLQQSLQGLAKENAELKSARKEDIKERRFATINAANLSAGTKQAFITALSSPTLDEETASQIMGQVHQLSTQEEKEYLQQHGSNEVTNLTVPTPEAPPEKVQFAYENYLQNRASRLGR